jgi:hypothetical protein
MEYLGIDQDIIRSAVSEIERQNQAPPPKDHHVCLDIWFNTLEGLSPERIRGIVENTEEAKRIWEDRLRQCRINWGDVHLSQGAIARLTVALYRSIKEEVVDLKTIKKQYERWKKGEYPVPEGHERITFFAQPSHPARAIMYSSHPLRPPKRKKNKPG